MSHQCWRLSRFPSFVLTSVPFDPSSPFRNFRQLFALKPFFPALLNAGHTHSRGNPKRGIHVPWSSGNHQHHFSAVFHPELPNLLADTGSEKYFVLFASPDACADHFEDHSNIKQNNYLVDIVAWKLFKVISQGKLFQATRSQTRLITGSPETTNPFFFLPINTLDFVFSAQRSGSAQTPLRSPAVPARRQHDQVWRHQGGLYMRIGRSVTNAFCQKIYIYLLSCYIHYFRTVGWRPTSLMVVVGSAVGL